MQHHKVTTWTLEFDRLEVVQLRELAAALDRFTQPTLRACLASVTFANPRVTLDHETRDELKQLAGAQPHKNTLAWAIWEALA